MGRKWVLVWCLLALVGLACARGAFEGDGPSVPEKLETYSTMHGRTMDLLDLGDSRKMRPHPTQHRLLGHEDLMYNSLASLSPVVVSNAEQISKEGGQEALLQWVSASLRSCAEQSVAVVLATAGGHYGTSWRVQYEPRSSGIPTVNVYADAGEVGEGGGNDELLLVIKFYVHPLGFDALNAELLAYEQLRSCNSNPESYALRQPLQHHRCLVSSGMSDRFFDSVIYRPVPGRSLTAMLLELKSEVNHVTEIEKTSGRLLSQSTMEMLLADHVKRISELHKILVEAIAQTARGLAELHLVTSQQDATIDPEALPQGHNLASALMAYMSSYPGLSEEARAAILREAAARLELANPLLKNELASFMHGDATTDNIVYDEATGKVGLLDLMSTANSFVLAERVSSELRASYPAVPVRKEMFSPIGHAAWDYFFFAVSATLVMTDQPALADILPVEQIFQAHYCAHRLLPATCVDENMLWADEVANYYQYVAFAAVAPGLLVKGAPPTKVDA